MKRILLNVILVLAGSWAMAQEVENASGSYTNAADQLLLKDSKLLIGGYGEVHFNQELSGAVSNNASLDVHRMVLLIGYNFSSTTQFISELEFEHVSEVYVEQAFLQQKLNNYFNLRAGLMLVPMGIINEYHEPTTFNGVERPLIDNVISPTTWREVGIGFSGTYLPASVKYQAYVVNGFNGYNGSATLSGKNGLRKGRQKGAESYMSSPNLTGKLEYFGIRGLNVGLSAYLGNTQSTLYDGLDKNDAAGFAKADSSVVGLSMIGVDSRYGIGGLKLRGQLYYAGLANTNAYNQFTANSKGVLNDLGSAMLGCYAEVGYNVFRSLKTQKELVPFVRYEFLDTHYKVESNIAKNLSYQKKALTAGITLSLEKGAVFKTDMQFIEDGKGSSSTVFNLGIGVMF